MIIKSFNLNEIKNTKSNFFLFYGENQGQKEDIIDSIFFQNFKGEIVKYDENQIIENKDNFLETCLNESLFEDKKILVINIFTEKLYSLIKELSEKNINNKKIIFNSGALDKKSKIRKLFEAEESLACIAFYKDNNMTLFKIANDFFKKNNISISGENINLVIEKCMGDRKNLYKEMNKILNFCFKKKKINRDEIYKLINAYDEENYFQLIDNCLAKNQASVIKVINNNNFGSNETLILIRSFLSRLKRLIELKKLQAQFGNIKETINNFRPPIFWKDKDIVEKQMKIWQNNQINQLLDEINNIEIKYKKNSNFSNNLIFDFILNTSNS